jgi:predicted nucleic-acid-binding Zn-ribbon protein
MRTTATCPKCSGKKIVVTEPCYIAGEYRMPRGLHPVVAGGRAFGRFESWICAACGYTELYALDLGDVDRLAEERPKDVRIIDSTVPTKGPFR